MKQIITRYSGVFAQSNIQINGDGDNVQISIQEVGEKEEQIIYTGCEYSQEEFEKQSTEIEKRWP